MHSEKKAAASRINGRKSLGPRTARGKARASQNALRHGLSTISRHNAAYASEIEAMARGFCGENSDPALLERAILIAENELILRYVLSERITTIDRMSDPDEMPFSRKNARLARRRVKARIDKSERAFAALAQISPRIATEGMVECWRPLSDEEAKRLHAMREQIDPLLDEVATEKNDDLDPVLKALPDLQHLARYERRAWSRRNRAINAFTAILSQLPY